MDIYLPEGGSKPEHPQKPLDNQFENGYNCIQGDENWLP